VSHAVQDEDAMTISDIALVGSYDWRLVALSIVIAVLGAYAGLDLAERVTAARGVARLLWLVGGVTAISIGIWSMHYTGMLAFLLPVPTQYDWPTALLSFVNAFVAAFVALFVVTRKQMGRRAVLVGSLFMGAGISGLHYIAMGSMRAPAMHHYAATLVTLSIVFAVGFSFLSLRLMFFFRGGDRGLKARRVASIVLSGAAICVMHYTGMAAVTFVSSSDPVDLSHALPVSFIGIVAIGSSAVTVLAVVVVTSMFDRLHYERELLKTTSERLRALSASVGSAREEEGIRIARELHDELGGALTSLKWELEAVVGTVSETLDRARVGQIQHQLMTMVTVIESTIGSVRRIAADLRPSVLDDLGLLDALEWQTHQFEVRTGVSCRYECSLGDVELTKEQATAVFRILQEALTNILRHAGASSVTVEVTRESGAFVLRVWDNGRGITDQARSDRRSLGILGMHERAILVGATCEVTRGVARGTQVVVRVPPTASSDVVEQ
jgi:signal transduction histidine kinase